MKLWVNASRSDIVTEIIPGVETPDQQAIDRLDWASYLSHMGEWLDEGMNLYEKAVKDHFDFLVFVLYGERTNIENGKMPEYNQAEAYMNQPETKELVQYLTDITTHLTRTNWPAFRQAVCDRYHLNPDDYRLSFE